jgi:hypothetical protein
MTRENSDTPKDLFDRVVSILEQARGNVVRAVNEHGDGLLLIAGRL